MLKPDQSPEEESEQDEPENKGPSFEELMMLVFSGPMCFECLEAEQEEDEAGVDEAQGTGDEES